MRFSWFITGFLYLSIASMGAVAQDVEQKDRKLTNKLESLVMPGPLTKPHAKYENDCSNCHSPLDKTGRKILCLECHKNVAQDIKQTRGFHGRHPQASVAECKSCHTDHEGRDRDIVGLSRETFNHNMTDFILTGQHMSVTCNQCHTEDKKFHEAKSDCFSCHETDDSHKGDMGKVCKSCHTPKAWQTVKFDHKKTDFPLKGGHEKLACKSCHPDTRYKKTLKDCVACHASNDEHEGRFGQKCNSCHNEQEWKTTRFDHNKDAGFLLKGKHGTIACEACHIVPAPKVKISTRCNDCHVTVDVHKGRNGNECQKCHTEKGWAKTTFSHDKDTKFILSGAHRDVDCFSCHRREKETVVKKRVCIDCHKPDDVHRGQLGLACDSCHGQVKWLDKINFDHDLTPFPLVGLHAITACDDCHTSKTFKEAKSNCIACHEADDSHKGALADDCAACHNPNGWDFWQFDHNKQTDFILDGAHEGLTCNGCHKKPVTGKIKLASNCIACHQSDDKHNGRFGTMCKRCHITEDFKTIRIGR